MPAPLKAMLNYQRRKGNGMEPRYEGRRSSGVFFLWGANCLYTDSKLLVHVSWVTSVCVRHYGPMDCSPPGSSVHGILQVRILEWVAMPSSRGSSPKLSQNDVTRSCPCGPTISGHVSWCWDEKPRDELNEYWSNEIKILMFFLTLISDLQIILFSSEVILTLILFWLKSDIGTSCLCSSSVSAED